MERLNEIRTALDKMVAAKPDDGGLGRELAEAVAHLAGMSEHNAEVIAADLDGKSDVLEALSKQAWDYARTHQQNGGYYMGIDTKLEIAAKYFAVEAPKEGGQVVQEKPAGAEKKILRLEDLL